MLPIALHSAQINRPAFLSILIDSMKIKLAGLIRVAALFSTQCLIAENVEVFTNTDRTAWGAHQTITTVEEQLPSAMDNEGNWSQALLGFQLGFRPDAKAFTLGQPVLASVTLRNLSRKEIDYVRRIHTGEHSELCQFDIRDSFGRQQVQINTNGGPYYPDQKWWSGTIKPKTQHRYRVRLDEIFDLSKPGLYTVTAYKEIFDGGTPHNLRSGTVQLEILPDPSSAVAPTRLEEARADPSRPETVGNKKTQKAFVAERRNFVKPKSASTEQPRTPGSAVPAELLAASSSEEPVAGSTLSARNLAFGGVLCCSALLLGIIFVRAARRMRS